MRRRETSGIGRVVAVKLALAGLVGIAAWLVAPGEPAYASMITVTTTTDSVAGDGLCSLREAITAANTDRAIGGCPAGSGADEIIVPAGTYVLTLVGANEDQNATGDLDIRSNVTISGAGPANTIIDGAQLDRVFDINVNSPVTVAISGVTIRRGSVVGAQGGGISNRYNGTVTLTNSTVSGNSANTSGWPGGGIYNEGTMIINNSTVNANFANSAGGGIFNRGWLTLTNTTVSGNSANSRNSVGGGIYHSDGNGVLSNVTIANNAAKLRGGGLDGTFTARNSIIAGNAAEFDRNCTSAIISEGHNLSDDASCFSTNPGTGDMADTQPLLGPLADNGGPTQTHALLFGSPAIDAGNPAAPGSGGTACESTDQRGVPRPQDGDGNLSEICDIGSYELDCSNPTSADGDCDGVFDAVDNCPTVQNTGQADGDVDRVGDACDNCPDAANAGQENTDAALSAGGASVTGDAAGDACDADDDNDSAGALANRTSGLCPGTGVPVFDDCVESYLETNPLDNCVLGPGTGGDAWPPDLAGDPVTGGPDGDVDTADIAVLTGNFGKVVPTRADLTTSGSIDTADIAILTGLFGDRCT